MTSEQQTLLDRYRARIEAELAHCCRPVGDPSDRVREAMLYAVSAGGKRIRPVLTMEFCHACGGDPEQALPFACAVELIHSYSLIHDDLPCMDDDDLRRGRPSCHIQFDEATALLAGDGLLTLAFSELGHAAEKGIPAESCLRAVSLLSDQAGVAGMVGGQMIDLEYEGKPIPPQTLSLLQQRKTGALLAAAAGLGVLAAKGSEAELAAALVYGQAMGMAFQLVDDMLDVVGSEATLGKPIGSDAAKGKTTAVTLYGLEGTKKLAAEYTVQAKEALLTFPASTLLPALTDALLYRMQ